MGREIRALFNVSSHAPDEEGDRAVEDIGAAVGALLADPLYEDLNVLDEGCTEAYRAMDDVQRGRVGYLLRAALHRVDKGGL